MLSDSLALSLTTKSDTLTVDEHTDVFTAAYDSAFTISIVKNLTKANSKVGSAANFSIVAPKDASKAANAAIEAAIKLKQTKKPLKSLITKHVKAALDLKAKKLVGTVLPGAFKVVEAMALQGCDF
jgi:Zn-dependent M16 (insulinase) family peptidase